MNDERLRAAADAIAETCGRCSGRGVERHQLDRDPAAGYGEHTCPSCRGAKRTVMHASPEEVARRAIEAADAAR